MWMDLPDKRGTGQQGALAAFVSLTRPDLGLRRLLDIAAEKAADVVALLEPPPLVAPDEALSGSRINQLAFICGHPRSSSSGLWTWAESVSGIPEERRGIEAQQTFD
jgi:hypothetical protein